MEHSHHKGFDSVKALKIGIILNIGFIIIEVFYGIKSNSTALLADAGHNFSDVMALGFSWFALMLSQRKPTLKFTYGLRRSTILAAMFNTIFLLAAVVLIIMETIDRLRHPVEIQAVSVIVVAFVGIAVNGFTAWLFVRGQKHDLNIRSAFLHFFADALVSFGVVVGGIIIAFTGFYLIDSLISFLIVAVILYSSYHLLIDSVHLALDAVPENINIRAIRLYLENLTEVMGIHDLHIWALSTTEAALTVHIVTNIQTDMAFISAIRDDLHNRFQVGHSTIQVEFGEAKPCDTRC
ncbi:MAG: cation diffusion facilitator family transporter [Prolixibacteraceae bacterium]